jgi:hypothetical protein
MKPKTRVLLIVAGIVSGLVNLYFASVTDWSVLFAIGGGLSLAFAAKVVITYVDIPEEVLTHIRGWHGSITEQFDNLDNLVNTLTSKETAWSVPQEMLKTLTDDRDQLSELIIRCRSNYGSAADRAKRNTLLKGAIGLCLTEVKAWAVAQFYAKVLTADDVHLLGFFVPSDAGGRRDRKDPTDVLAEVKVRVVNSEYIRVVIDQASNENSALVAHGWPEGVRQALIVILDADGKIEVLRLMTTRLHNDIQMPKGSQGKIFIIKAAFLRHVDDAPKFGPEPTFSMPLTTEDLAAEIDRQHHEDFEMRLRAVEQHRQEVEQMRIVKKGEGETE